MAYAFSSQDFEMLLMYHEYFVFWILCGECVGLAKSVSPCSMGPDTAWMGMAVHGCRQALGVAGPLLVGIKAGGIWLQRSSKNSK